MPCANAEGLTELAKLDSHERQRDATARTQVEIKI
jgi:hypothetical protein